MENRLQVLVHKMGGSRNVCAVCSGVAAFYPPSPPPLSSLTFPANTAYYPARLRRAIRGYTQLKAAGDAWPCVSLNSTRNPPITAQMQHIRNTAIIAHVDHG